MPLVQQPGTVWEYGTGIDWAGIVLERATGVKLNDWIQQNIMQPLGLKNINMLPTPEMKKNLAYMHQKWPGSSAAEERDHIYREPIIAETDHEKKHIFNSGGAGCFAQPKEYVQVLVALLNDGKSPTTGAQILKPETVKAMWENQIPEQPDFARRGVVAAKTEQTNPLPEMYPQEGMKSRVDRDLASFYISDSARRQSTSGLGSELLHHARSRCNRTREEYGLVGRHCEPLLVV